MTGITLSRQQLAYARERIAAAGLDDRVELRLQDYRDVAETYDHVVSIEMFEAVGEQYWPVYFDTVRRVMRPGGRASLQVITIDAACFEPYRRSADFIQKYVFPGGLLQSASLSEAVRQEARNYAANWVRRDDNRILIAFGGQSKVVLQPDTQWPEISDQSSDMVSALNMSHDLLNGNPGMITVATDGLVKEPMKVSEAIERIKTSGTKINFIQLGSIFNQTDGYIDTLISPPILWEGTPIDILVQVNQPPSGKAKSLELEFDGIAYSEPPEEISDSQYRLSY